MAAFFANIQVRSSDCDAVAEAVTALLARAGFQPEPEVYGGDRSVYVGIGGDDWVAVFDSATDGTTIGPLAWLAQGLSVRLQCVTLAWMVYDAALLYLLFDRGEVVDRYISRPAMFKPDSAELAGRPSPPLGGDGERLLEVIGVAGDGRLVSRWLAQPDDFPHMTLERIATMLGQQFADVGHGDIESDQLDHESLEGLDCFMRLEFVRTIGQATSADR